MLPSLSRQFFKVRDPPYILLTFTPVLATMFDPCRFGRIAVGARKHMSDWLQLVIEDTNRHRESLYIELDHAPPYGGRVVRSCN